MVKKEVARGRSLHTRDFHGVMRTMLDLTRSKTRAAVLQTLFADIEREWHVRGLARELGVSVGNTRRELLRLVDAGHLVVRRQANLVLYRLDTTHPLYPELRSLVSKTVGIEARIASALTGVPGVRLVFVYGSLAAHRETSGSDIDLMVVGTPATRAVHSALRPVERELRREINFHIFAAAEFSQRVRSGDGFLVNVLAGPVLMVIGEATELRALT